MAEKPLLLIVEDDPGTASLLETYFQSQGYRIQCVRHGEEAEPLSQETRPDIVLLDVRLPGIDGFEVARRLRRHRRTSKIPILMLTDMQERSDRLKGLEVGVDDYIAKPFDLQEIGLRVRNTIERAGRKRTTNPVTDLPEGKPVEDALQRVLLQPEWSIVTIRIGGLDAYRAGRGFPAADDMAHAIGRALQNAAAAQLKVGAMVGHLTFDEFVILGDMPSLLEFAQSAAAKLKETAQAFYPVMAKADPAQKAAEVTLQFRFLSSSDGTFPSLDALQNALDQTPYRTL
ncbi:MAG: response regulator [Anaerolineales bacterium]|nr:response regulator [Anaerolineales bacterium]